MKYSPTATKDENHKYKISIKCMKIKINDDPECNIGRHFDKVADKIGKKNISYDYIYYVVHWSFVRDLFTYGK